MFTVDDLRKHVDAFLAETSMSATLFGKKAVGDPKFVFELREGREPRRATTARVLTFIERQHQPAAEQQRGAA